MSRLIARKLLMSRGSGAVRIVCARFYRPLPRRVKSDRLLDRNELRVCAARSRRRSSVGRTRGVGRRLALWRFHQGRSERGLIIAAQPAWSAWYDRSIAAGSGAFKTIGNVIWSKVGPSVALETGDLRGVPRHAAARPDDGGGGIRTDHGAMACCGVCGPSVRMKTSGP